MRILLVSFVFFLLSPAAFASDSLSGAGVVEEDDGIEVIITDTPKSVTQSGRYILHPGPLRDQIDAWAVNAGYQLKWNCDYDIMVEFDSSFGNTFPLAVSQVVQALRSAGTPISGTFYSRSKVLVINGD